MVKIKISLSSLDGTYSNHSALEYLKYENRNFTFLFHGCESRRLVQRDEH